MYLEDVVIPFKKYTYYFGRGTEIFEEHSYCCTFDQCKMLIKLSLHTQIEGSYSVALV